MAKIMVTPTKRKEKSNSPPKMMNIIAPNTELVII